VEESEGPAETSAATPAAAGAVRVLKGLVLLKLMLLCVASAWLLAEELACVLPFFEGLLRYSSRTKMRSSRFLSSTPLIVM
jgi:hypothetical protein